MRTFELREQFVRRARTHATLFGVACAWLAVQAWRSLATTGTVDRGIAWFAGLCLVIAVIMWAYPLRASLEVSDDAIDYHDGVLGRVHVPFESVRTAFYSESGETVMLDVGPGARKIKIRYRFEDMPGFLDVLRRSSGEVVDFDAVREERKTSRGRIDGGTTD